MYFGRISALNAYNGLHLQVIITFVLVLRHRNISICKQRSKWLIIQKGTDWRDWQESWGAEGKEKRKSSQKRVMIQSEDTPGKIFFYSKWNIILFLVDVNEGRTNSLAIEHEYFDWVESLASVF